MMRRSSIVSLSALLLMLTAGCQGMRENPQQEADTPSYIGVSVRVAGDYSGSLRAVTDKQQKEPGIDRERSVTGASLLLRDYVAIPFSFPSASTIADSYESEVKSVYPKGELDMALLVNSSALGNLSRPDFRDDRTLALSDLPKTYGNSGMLMTSTVADGSKNKGTIYPGKTEAEVRAKTFNHFSFDVERVVAKLQVTMKKGTKLELPMGTLSPLTYSMAGSAKETSSATMPARVPLMRPERMRSTRTLSRSLIPRPSRTNGTPRRLTPSSSVSPTRRVPTTSSVDISAILRR